MKAKGEVAKMLFVSLSCCPYHSNKHDDKHMIAPFCIHNIIGCVGLDLQLKSVPRVLHRYKTAVRLLRCVSGRHNAFLWSYNSFLDLHRKHMISVHQMIEISLCYGTTVKAFRQNMLREQHVF
eukprot:663538-Amphidinium_carterae.1